MFYQFFIFCNYFHKVVVAGNESKKSGMSKTFGDESWKEQKINKIKVIKN